VSFTVQLCAVGDVFIDRDDPPTALAGTTSALPGGVLFGNCEGVFSDQWERAPSSGSPVVAPAANAVPLARAGFDVLSLANNHSVDGGHGALLRCRQTLQDLGLHTVGAGANSEEARMPACIVKHGVRITFLAYTAVFPHGYEARTAVPGVAPIRAHTFYSPWEVNEWNPGLAPRVSTEPFPQDVDALLSDIANARRAGDVLVVSVHWGDFTRPFVLTDHERRIARLLVDAGADIVFGHHHHALRGVEFHRGSPIFYGLGHYLFDLPHLEQRLARDGYLSAARPEDERALARRFGEYRIRPRDGYPRLPFHEDSRMTGAAVVTVGSNGVGSVGFRPAVIDAANQPNHVAPDDPQGQQVIDYLRRCCAYEGLTTQVARPEKGSELPVDCVQLLPGEARSI
jgi:hypothetical protein